MPSKRKARIAMNEVMFRAANERAADWEERHPQPEDVELYQCECASLECRDKVGLLKADYERVRRDPTQFFVLPGHETPDAETVVESHEGWLVVQKDPETHAIAETTDERTP